MKDYSSKFRDKLKKESIRKILLTMKRYEITIEDLSSFEDDTVPVSILTKTEKHLPTKPTVRPVIKETKGWSLNGSEETKNTRTAAAI